MADLVLHLGGQRQLAVQRPDAFMPDLATSLNNLAEHLRNLGRCEEAFTTAHEAVALLSPSFLTHPSRFAHLMSEMIQTYLHCAAQLQREPDVNLLLPLRKVFNVLQEGPAEESDQ